jgi:hypothetical protein
MGFVFIAIGSTSAGYNPRIDTYSWMLHCTTPSVGNTALIVTRNQRNGSEN